MGNRILVAIDDSPSSTTTVDHASALARKDEAEVHVLLVNSRVPGGRGHYHLTTREAEGVVRAAVDQLADLGVVATGAVARANVLDLARAIVDEAESQACDRIILGSRRRRGVLRMFGHGVREKVVSLSHLPVVAAPAPLRLTRVTLAGVAVPPTAPRPDTPRSRAAREVRTGRRR